MSAMPASPTRTSSPSPASRPSPSRPHLRCAIYTRKSSEEGLGQEFNSLDAQREACAAYVASQKHEGWRPVAERYDDGGLSGGTLDRPALRRLLAEIDAGRVQMVVVYKIDRLTRSLADFAQLVERFERAGCSFVSVTQAFNTSTSMGRLTLNVLLSFAQFEREVTAERIRDKIAASKRKGLWMGGTVPLGYDRHPDPQKRELVINDGEAEQVQALFCLYDQLGGLREVEQAAAERGYRSKHQVFSSGRTRGGPLSRGQIHYLLTNPTYRGLIRHKAEVHPGLHPALVEQDLWDRVQAKLQQGSARPRGRRGRLAVVVGTGAEGTGAPLTGKLRDDTGDRLTPTHAVKAGRRLRYYTSHRLITGGADRSGWRLPAPALEGAVAAVLGQHLERAAARYALLAAPDARGAAGLQAAATALVNGLREAATRDRLLRSLIASGQIEPGRLSLTLDGEALAAALVTSVDALAPSLLTLDAPLQMRRRGVELRLVAGPREATPAPDATLCAALARAHRWVGALRQGRSLAELAQAERTSEACIRTRAPLAFLAPRIQAALLEGAQPVDLTLERIVRTGIPLDWTEQEQCFGFAG